MKYPMFDKNDNAILYEHEFNHIPNAEAAFKYEYGTKKDQKGKYWWECDCGGSMYVTKKFIKEELR